MQRFGCIDTPLSGLKVIERKPIADARGFLSRLFCAEEMDNYGFLKPTKQVNQTLTREKGSVRGLHYQLPPHAEIKLVNCIKGEILDIAVDLRRDSPTFLQWHGEILSDKNHKSLLIPEGFAHGFQTLTDDCELLYFHSAAYAKDAEAALNISDPRLAIQLPLKITDISQRDIDHPMINNNFEGIVL